MLKERLLQLAIEQVSQQLEQLRRHAELTRAGAIHEEARPENDKDTRALEQSYLARGQAERVAQTEASLQRLKFLQNRAFGENTPIASSALVQLDQDGEQRWVYLIPVAGGMKLSLEQREVQLLSLEAPLAQELLGKVLGDEFELVLAGVARSYEILHVE